MHFFPRRLDQTRSPADGSDVQSIHLATTTTPTTTAGHDADDAVASAVTPAFGKFAIHPVAGANPHVTRSAPRSRLRGLFPRGPEPGSRGRPADRPPRRPTGPQGQGRGGLARGGRRGRLAHGDDGPAQTDGGQGVGSVRGSHAPSRQARRRHAVSSESAGIAEPPGLAVDAETGAGIDAGAQTHRPGERERRPTVRDAGPGAPPRPRGGRRGPRARSARGKRQWVTTQSRTADDERHLSPSQVRVA
jgi:hypothetical protein